LWIVIINFNDQENLQLQGGNEYILRIISLQGSKVQDEFKYSFEFIELQKNSNMFGSCLISNL
jgi:hypothetical protein